MEFIENISFRERWVNPLPAEAREPINGNQKKKTNFVGIFFLTGLQPVLPLSYYLQGKAWPDRVENLMVEHNYVLSHHLHSKAWPDCVYWNCIFVITCTANAGAGSWSLFARQGMASLS